MMIPDTAVKCPNCGAPNQHVVRTAKGQPETIAELEQWYKDRGLPPYEVTRFFIGVNCKEPRAFGIYKDEEGNFVVYKNKDNCSRAVRYKGTDEAYAVNEIFMRLKQEIIQQKNAQRKSGQAIGQTPATSSDGGSAVVEVGKALAGGIFGMIKLWALFMGGGAAILIIVGIFVAIFDDSPSQGYYNYGGTTYYSVSGDADSGWYYYDDTYDWQPVDANQVPDELKQTPSSDDFYYTPTWDSSTQITDFESSPAYAQYQAESEDQSYSNDDDSSDYDWDSSDSWDSGSTDWGSDW